MSPNLDRLVFTLCGILADRFPMPAKQVLPNQQFVSEWYTSESPVYILPAFWYAPDFKTAVREMHDIKIRLGEGNDRFRPGVAVFVRTMGDVSGSDFNFDTSSLDDLFKASIQQKMPFFINISGIQWTEVYYNNSPLIQKLMSNLENRVILNDGNPSPRIKQPGWQDKNGLSYLCMFAPDVGHYWDRNLKQLAAYLSEFARGNQDLFIGISTENETDLPGRWAAGGRDSDYNPNFKKVYSSVSDTINWQQFRINSVRQRNEKSAAILLEAGIPREKIYTHVSTEDEFARASPLEVGIVPSAGNLGVVWWGYNHFPENILQDYNRAASRTEKNWGILASNTLSLNPEDSSTYLTDAIKFGANPIVLYCWWPHFLGYGIKGLPLERAARAFLG